jgi:hypothetical protein
LHLRIYDCTEPIPTHFLFSVNFKQQQKW